jgi:hypothetical protein
MLTVEEVAPHVQLENIIGNLLRMGTLIQISVLIVPLLIHILHREVLHALQLLPFRLHAQLASTSRAHLAARASYVLRARTKQALALPRVRTALHSALLQRAAAQSRSARATRGMKRSETCVWRYVMLAIQAQAAEYAQRALPARTKRCQAALLATHACQASSLVQQGRAAQARVRTAWRASGRYTALLPATTAGKARTVLMRGRIVFTARKASSLLPQGRAAL